MEEILKKFENNPIEPHRLAGLPISADSKSTISLIVPKGKKYNLFYHTFDLIKDPRDENRKYILLLLNVVIMIFLDIVIIHRKVFLLL